MENYGFVIPILPGMVERDRQFAAELSGPRRAEHTASRARLGQTRELVWLQQTEQGPVAVVYLEAEDVGKLFAGLAISDGPFDVWWRQQIQEIHGLDLSKPMPGPPNEQILNFHAAIR
jgi:hypothetical protein